MYSTVLSATLHGLEAEFVNVEADVSNGLPMFHMVGYLSSEVKEAGERVRTAIKNAGFEMAPKKMVINLSPANVRKRGASFDLPIALALLVTFGHLKQEVLDGKLAVGELGLDGTVRKVKGILPIVLEAKARGLSLCIVPEENAAEAALVEGIQVAGVKDLAATVRILSGEEAMPEVSVHMQGLRTDIDYPDYQDIRGQEVLKRASEVAVAGKHHMLLIGPPGAGKTMLAQRIPGIFPKLNMDEALELTKIYSAAGKLSGEHPLVDVRPFREVNSSVTKSALLGGGAYPTPGEITLASEGVLFMDELAEFPRPVLELLREPLEDREIKIVRTKGVYHFPADFMLVAAMNPCPCGAYPDRNQCKCTDAQIAAYQRKLSYPFLDRIDICVEAPKVGYQELVGKAEGESSEMIRERVTIARQIQKTRFADCGIICNGEMRVSEVEKYCILEKEDAKLMEQVYEKFHLTARTYHKILKVARTIADLSGEERIKRKHLMEAVGYRTFQSMAGR